MTEHFNIYITAVIFFWLLIKLNESFQHSITSNHWLHEKRLTICYGATHASLVEHFFNHILTEFHNTPPVCVCVQMCLNQSTYCYPKDCLKLGEYMKHDVSTTEAVTKSSTKIYSNFVEKSTVSPVDDQEHFELNSYIDNKYKTNLNNEISITKIARTDPFQTRYKTIFSTKRKPKLQFSYDIKEQVRSMILENLNKMEAHVVKTRWPYSKRKPIHTGYTSTGYPKEEEIVDNTETQSKEIANFGADSFNMFKKKYIENDNDEEPYKYFVQQNIRHIDEAQYSIQTLIENILRSNETEINTDESSSRRVKMNVEIKEPNNTDKIINDNLDLNTELVYTDKGHENIDFSFQDNKTNAINYDGIDLIYSVIGEVQSNEDTSRKTFFDVLSPIEKLTNETINLGLKIVAESVTVDNSSNVNNFKIKEVDEDFMNHSNYIVDRNSTLPNTVSEDTFYKKYIL